MEGIISKINGNDVSKFVDKGLTKMFFDEQEAIDFAKEKRSYYYAASYVAMIVFCVPK